MQSVCNILDLDLPAACSYHRRMREGTCPSCGGTEVYAARNGVALGEHATVGLRPDLAPGFRGAVRLHPSEQFWAYLCAACGLVEFHLHDEAAVAFARQNWARIPTPPAAG